MTTSKWNALIKEYLETEGSVPVTIVDNNNNVTNKRIKGNLDFVKAELQELQNHNTVYL